MNLTERTYLWPLVILRVWLGYYLLQQGLEKFLSDFPHQDWITKHIGDLEKADLYPWYESFLDAAVMPNPELFGYLVIYGEILVGVCLVAGLLTRLSAALGAFQVGNYILGPGMAGGGSSLAHSETFLVALVVVFLSNPGRTLGVDAFLSRKKNKKKGVLL